MSALADNGGPRPDAPRLGEILVDRGMLTSEQLAIALADQQISGKQLGAILVERGFAAPTTVAAALATQHGGLLKTEYGFATAFDAVPIPAAPVAPAAQPATSAPALRVSPPPVAAQPPAAPPPARPEAVPVETASPPADDQRLVRLMSEIDELGSAMAAASAELDALAGENVRLAAELAESRDARAADADRLAAESSGLKAQLAELAGDRDSRLAAASAGAERIVAENTSLSAQVAELTAERDARESAPEPGNEGLAARVAELELHLARVTNRGSIVSERLDEVIGEVARLSERLDAAVPSPSIRVSDRIEQAAPERWGPPDAA